MRHLPCSLLGTRAYLSHAASQIHLPASASVTDRTMSYGPPAPTGGDDDPYTLSFRGIDNSTYYMLDKTQYVQLLNYSGCGNSISGNHPQVKQMIIDACKQ